MKKLSKDLEAKKKNEIAGMFNHISPKYDFLNRFLSFGIDTIWRRKAIAQLSEIKPKTILDIATGTGDLAIAAQKLNPEKIIGIDISKGMLEVGKQKIEKRNLQNLIELHLGDSENIPFPNNTFNAVMVAFGVRNFEHLQNGINEMFRVMTVGGKVMILEFSKPHNFPVKQFYNFYLKFILPLWGRIISGNNVAYTYLNDSVQKFPEGEHFLTFLNNAGFKNTKIKRLTFGVASIYTGEKLLS